ncbi:MAG TPA: hypothetical protein VLB49_08315 [Gemmatimonadales bacterium]|nr:hypothetical protein [Gemmatimonadales bacterium]
MRPQSIAGLLLLVAGLFVALRGVSYRSSRSDIRVGDFQASLEERRTIPPWVGWAGAGLGLVLVVGGLRSRRGS